MLEKKVKSPAYDSKAGDQNKNMPMDDDRHRLNENLSMVDHKIIVLSGKGGVGKSMVATNLAVELSEQGYMVGLLDIDIHGPSIPTLLGLGNQQPSADAGGRIVPLTYNNKVKVVSIGFLLKSSDDAIIWRGPLKYSVIKQFLKDVVWGQLDYLIIDSPPGTGDEPLSVCQLIDNPSGAVIVTTPQDVALIDVRKSVTFCKKLNMPVIGVIENMSGFVCPHCSTTVDIFKSGGGEKMAQEMDIPFLGKIPIDAAIPVNSDMGKPFVLEKEGSKDAKQAFMGVVKKIIEKGDEQS